MYPTSKLMGFTGWNRKVFNILIRLRNDGAQKGKIPAIKLDQIRRFRRKEIDGWLEEYK